MTLGFPDSRVGTYRRSVLHLNLVSVIDGSTLNWCAQKVLGDAMSKDLLFYKIAEPELIAVNFNNQFRDRIGEVERGHFEVYPKMWKLRSHDKTNGEVSRIPKLLTAYQKLRKETEDWNYFRRLPEEIPEYPLIRRMLVGAESVVQPPIMRVF